LTSKRLFRKSTSPIENWSSNIIRIHIWAIIPIWPEICFGYLGSRMIALMCVLAATGDDCISGMFGGGCCFDFDDNDLEDDRF